MVVIYEPLYKFGQTLAEDRFFSFDMRENPRPQWREFWIYLEIYRRQAHLEDAMCGLFSPKFQMKTGLAGGDFIQFVENNPDADVCFVNPFPQLALTSFNVWMEGELAHPGLTERAQALLDATGIGWDLAATPRHGPEILCYSNFWVGNRRLWDTYVGGILEPIAQFIEANQNLPLVRQLFDNTEHTSPSPFLPFIIERLFSTYLSFNPQLSIASYRLDPMALALNDMERHLVAHYLQALPEVAEMKAFLAHASVCRQLYNGLLYSTIPHPHLAQEPVS